MIEHTFDKLSYSCSPARSAGKYHTDEKFSCEDVGLGQFSISLPGLQARFRTASAVNVVGQAAVDDSLGQMSFGIDLNQRVARDDDR